MDKTVVKHEGNCDTNSYWSLWDSPQEAGKEIAQEIQTGFEGIKPTALLKLLKSLEESWRAE